MADSPQPTPQPIVRRRDLRIAPRDPGVTATLADVNADDVMHARATADAVCTVQYRRYLGAALDVSVRIPRGDRT